jgi:hypothetical protein
MSLISNIDEIGRNNELSRLVAKNSISLDGEKLFGLDNFMIDERRIKVSISRLNNNTQNNELIDVLTDRNNLSQDNLTKTTANALYFSKEDIIARTSDNVLFWREFNDSDNQTWKKADGKFYVQSDDWVDAIYSAIIQFFSRKA